MWLPEVENCRKITLKREKIAKKSLLKGIFSRFGNGVGVTACDDVICHIEMWLTDAMDVLWWGVEFGGV